MFKQRWAELIKKVYEADPLLCPRCGGAMCIIALIDQPEVIEKILTHLGLWPHTAHAPPNAVVASCCSTLSGGLCVHPSEQGRAARGPKAAFTPPPPLDRLAQPGVAHERLDMNRGKNSS